MKKQVAKTATPKLRFPEFQGASGWNPTPLGKSGAFIRGLTYGAEDVQDDGLLVIRSANIQDGGLVLDKDLVFVGKKCAPDQTLQSGDIAICMSNGSKALVGKSAEYSGDYAGALTVGAFCSIFRPSLPFAKLAFESKSYANFVALAIGGGNINNLKNSDLESFEFAIPDSPFEQQKVADCLTSLDEVIAAQGRKVDALKAHKRGLMQQLFPREGETRPRLRFPEFRKAPGWSATSLGAWSKSFSGGTPSTSRRDYYGGTIPFIRSAEIGSAETELCLTQAGLQASSAKLVAMGDVLLALYGANSGDVALAQTSGAINQAILCIRPDGCKAFLYHYLTALKPWLVATFLQGGQGNLSGEIVKSIDIRVPSSEEQQRIADCLSSLDTRITAETARLAALKTHKQGLMQQLFPVPEGM